MSAACNDVRQCEETGIWHFHVSDEGPKQKIKTPNARRDVPINQALLDKGFLDYFRRRKQDRKTQLFNCTATGKDDDWSRNFTQRFNRFLANRLGYESGNRPGAYSLRHTFINALKQSDRPEHVVADIVGHSKRAITFDRYGKPAGLAKNAAVINSVNFFIAGWLDSKAYELSYTTMRGYCSKAKFIDKHFKRRDPLLIKPRCVREFLQRLLRRGYSNKTVNEYLIVLRGVFQRLLEDEEISQDPTRNLGNFRTASNEPDPFTREEISKITPVENVLLSEMALLDGFLGDWYY